MGRQLKLVLLVFLSLGILGAVVSSTPKPIDLVGDDLVSNDLLTENVKEEQLKITKIVELPPATSVRSAEASTSESTPPSSTSRPSTESTTTTRTTSTTTSKTPTKTTRAPISEEYLQDLIEAAHHSDALADDLRFNKMLPEKFNKENSTHKKEETEATYADYNIAGEYDDLNYDDDDDASHSEIAKKDSQKNKKATTEKGKEKDKGNDKKIEMKPIEDKNKSTKAKEETKKSDNSEDNDIDEDYYDEDEDDEDDDDEENDDDDEDTEDAEHINYLSDVEETVFSENVPCPRYCTCSRNVNSYLLATCSRLDAGTQKFGSDITDIVVTDVGPKYPILIGPKFFLQLGLKHVSSIKIANCTIEYLHPEAFHGLDNLFAVNLTDVGLNIINSDTFAKNKKLRILTISGNDLSIMSSLPYLLKSSSIEELDLSKNNLMELSENAFSKLSKIVYINLAHNSLQKIPENVFSPVETIEELDLSSNELKGLPANIFNRTALAILHLKYNDFTDNFSFGNTDLQQLDLSFNSIQEVNHRMFDKMTGLTNLNLKGNGITKIHADSFFTLKRLRHIDLAINELEQLSSMIFYKNSELDVIRLHDNPKLGQLPTDGFKSYNGFFTVYYLDISNCAIGALGHKTFSTMPHLATLKLAWNNINNLEPDTFQTLTKLTELDLSNNLIYRLDDQMFTNNNDLVTLNLAGNPIRKLSTRLFLPFTKLRELDVSDCELTSLLADNQFGIGRKFKFFETLRSFNASNNQIRTISPKDVKNFKNLVTLDIGQNPLKCNTDFQDFIRHILLNTNIVPKKKPTMAEMQHDDKDLENESPALWGQVARQVCDHHDSLAREKDLDERFDIVEKELEKDQRSTLNMINHNDIDKNHILKDSRKKTPSLSTTTTSNPNDDYESEYVVGTADKDSDKDNEDTDNDDSEYDDEEDDEEDINETGNQFDEKLIDFTKIKDHGVKIEEVELKNEVKDQVLLGKFVPYYNEEGNLVLYEEHHWDYSHFYISLVVVAIVIFLGVKCICTISRRRQMALMDKKHSFVYQKLTEEIKPPIKKQEIIKQPKVHRYAPINPV